MMDNCKDIELTKEDLRAIRRGMEDIKSGRIITLDEYEQLKLKITGTHLFYV